MSVTPIPRGTGQSRNPEARLVCDECCAETRVACDYFRGPGALWTVNEGQALKKAQGLGWARVKGVLRCPVCVAARRAPKIKEAAVAENVTDLRQPTRDQKRQIIGLLTDTYDTEAGRYRGRDTDQTLAEVMGGGVMPGWVAAIREELFGPEGGNDELERLAVDVREHLAQLDARATALHETLAGATAGLREMNELKAKAAEHLKRIEAIKAAVGPRAARA
jgi:hypothetical protein